MIKGAIVVALLFRVIDAINTFELIYVMTKGGPGRATQTLSILGWKTAFQGFDLGGSAALGVVMLVVTTICAHAHVPPLPEGAGMTRAVAGQRDADGMPQAAAPPAFSASSFLAVVLVFVLFPLVWLALGSLKTPPRCAGAAAHASSSTRPSRLTPRSSPAASSTRFGNSLTIALTNVSLALLIGTPAAFALTRMRGKMQENLSFWVLSIRMAPLFAVILPLYVLFKCGRAARHAASPWRSPISL